MSQLSDNILSGVDQIPNFIPAGTRMIFAQSSAPSGWQTDAPETQNLSGLRVVSSPSSWAGSGGSQPWNNVMRIRDVPLRQHSHGIIQSDHSHGYTDRTNEGTGGGSGGGGADTSTKTLDKTTSGASANISLQSAEISVDQFNGTQSSAVMNFDLKYVDVIICKKL